MDRPVAGEQDLKQQAPGQQSVSRTSGILQTGNFSENLPSPLALFACCRELGTGWGGAPYSAIFLLTASGMPFTVSVQAFQVTVRA